MRKTLTVMLTMLLLCSAVAVHAADDYGKTLSGKILLAVEDQGKAYYIDFNGQAHYLKDADTAFAVMRDLAVGINKSGAQQIRNNDKSFTLQHRGALFMSVEENGEVYYIDFNGESHYLKDGTSAYRVMRGMSLGVSNTNLAKLTIANQLPDWVDNTRNAVAPTATVVRPITNLPNAQMSGDQAKALTLDFVNNFLLSNGVSAQIGAVDLLTTRLFKLHITVDGDEVDSYLTDDGQLFFPEALNVAEIKAAPANETSPTSTPSTSFPKTVKPIVELFVMSHCPYGTQMEKGILPAINALGDKVDFQVKFVDYAMHGKKEVDEELNQYCIQKQGRTKYLAYLTCFLIDGDNQRCLAETKVDLAAMNTCVKATDAEFKVNELFADESTWQGGSYPQINMYKADNTKYGVSGSPTLVINGQEANTGRDSASLLSSLCSAFTERPAECDTALSSDTPAPGFGTTTTTVDNNVQCQ
jgi:hypothetical protein